MNKNKKLFLILTIAAISGFFINSSLKKIKGEEITMRIDIGGKVTSLEICDIGRILNVKAYGDYGGGTFLLPPQLYYAGGRDIKVGDLVLGYAAGGANLYCASGTIGKSIELHSLNGIIVGIRSATFTEPPATPSSTGSSTSCGTDLSCILGNTPTSTGGGATTTPNIPWIDNFPTSTLNKLVSDLGPPPSSDQITNLINQYQQTTTRTGTTPGGTTAGDKYPKTVTVNIPKLSIRTQPNTTSALGGSRYLRNNDTFTAKSWVNGENVGGEKRWWVSTKGNYIWVGGTKEKPSGTPPSSTTTPAAPAPTYRKVTINIDITSVRTGPKTSAPLGGSQYLYYGDSFTAKSYVIGEKVSGENRWWVTTKGNYIWVGATAEKP